MQFYHGISKLLLFSKFINIGRKKNNKRKILSGRFHRYLSYLSEGKIIINPYAFSDEY